MGLGRLRLDRALVFLDLETTGVDPALDRIVQIAVLRIEPDGSREARDRLIDPERPIPAGATAVHGIGDADVRGAPTFRQVARALLAFLGDADLAGYNVARFDLPLLERQFRECGLDLRLGERRVLDAMVVYHRMEPRDLSAAVRFYVGREHAAAHSASADVAAAADVLAAQLERYPELPQSVADLERWICRTPSGAIDRAGRFVWRDAEAVVNFGRFDGRGLREVAAEQRDYLEWLLQQPDFPADARRIVAEALDGRFPICPGGDVAPV